MPKCPRRFGQQSHLRVEILDSKGAAIRTFTNSEAEAAKASAERPTNAEENFFRGPRDPKPPLVAGHHRINWDLRYPGATEFPGLIMWAASSRGPPWYSRGTTTP